MSRATGTDLGTNLASYMADGGRPVPVVKIKQTTDTAYTQLPVSAVYSISIEEGTSQSGKFCVGGAIIGKCEIVFNLTETSAFDYFDFTGAKMWVDACVPGHESETTNYNNYTAAMGLYYFVSHKKSGSFLSCTGYDLMGVLDETDRDEIAFGVSFASAVAAIADDHSAQYHLPTNYPSASIRIFGSGGSTQRQVLSDACACSGLYCKMKIHQDTDGTRKETIWCDSYPTTDTHNVDVSLSTPEIDTSDKKVTALKYDKTKSALATDDGITITIEDNAVLKNCGDSFRQQMMSWALTNNIGGITFRAGSATILSSLAIEAGDRISLLIKKGETTGDDVRVSMLVTTLRYKFGLGMDIVCDCEETEVSDIKESAAKNYTWVAYSSVPTGADATLTPDSSTRYIGIATGMQTITPDLTDPSVFTWSLCRGDDGYNTAIVSLYQRVASGGATPAVDWSASTTYTFATGGLSYTPPGWSTTVPSGLGTLYVATATAMSKSATDDIVATEFRVTALPDGAKLNNATVVLCKRGATTPSLPNNTITYSFVDGSVTETGLNGWTVGVPEKDGNPCWITHATASSTSSSASILSSAWSTPVEWLGGSERPLSVCVLDTVSEPIVIIDSSGTESAESVGSIKANYAATTATSYITDDGEGTVEVKVDNVTAIKFETTTSGQNSKVASTFGSRNTDATTGWLSMAEGNSIVASGDCSHGEGEYTRATGRASHAEGSYTKATGYGAHAEGGKDGNVGEASGDYSHTEGAGGKAEGDYSHAEGDSCEAIGDCSHAEGYATVANANYSHASGMFTHAGHTAMTAVGRYNVQRSNTENVLFAVGNGFGANNRSDAMTVYEDGTVKLGNTNIKSVIANYVYPIGSIYTSMKATPPASLFGFGYWTRIKDRMILSADSDIGELGGSAEMPSHSHTFTGSSGTTNAESTDHTHGLASSRRFMAAASTVTSLGVHKVASGSTTDYSYVNTDGNSGGATTLAATSGKSGTHTHTFTPSGTVGATGSSANAYTSGGENNLPPYIKAYMWQRVGNTWTFSTTGTPEWSGAFEIPVNFSCNGTNYTKIKTRFTSSSPSSLWCIEYLNEDGTYITAYDDSSGGWVTDMNVIVIDSGDIEEMNMDLLGFLNHNATNTEGAA